VLYINQYTRGREKTHTSFFFDSFLRSVLWLNDTAKVSEGANRNTSARNALVHLYTNPGTQNAQRHRRTDDRITPTANRLIKRRKPLLKLAAARTVTH